MPGGRGEPARDTRAPENQTDHQHGQATNPIGELSTAPGLLIRLERPARVFILADDLEQQREAERVAQLVLELLERWAA